MTHQQPTRASHQSTTSLSTARTSTSSLTLIDNHFSPPSRTGTDSSSDSSLTITSTTSRRRSSTSTNPNRNSSHFHSTRPTTSPPQNQSQAAILRAREPDRQHRLSARQAEQLRHKGTFTDSGRHSDDWLFGGWSFKDSVRGAWRWAAAGKGNGKEGE